jgi:hypothetical protein
VSRDAWGRLLVAIALVATAALCWRRLRSTPASAVVLFAGLWLWSAFMWPTRVHERYLLFCVPFMIAAAAAVPRLRPAVVALVIVATLEHSWMIWRPGVPVGTFDRDTAERVHDETFQSYWRGREVTLENAKAAPTREATLASYWQRYRAQRRRSEGVEWLVTIASLGAYAWAFVIVATTLPGAARRARSRRAPGSDPAGSA